MRRPDCFCRPTRESNIANPVNECRTHDDATQAQPAGATWLSDLSTPVQAFPMLRARGHRVCLLESAEGPARLSRYSSLGTDISVSVRARREGVMVTRPERRVEPFDATADEQALKVGGRA